jgi:hypothetical protein
MTGIDGCGAKTRAGASCRRPAGWGTDHVGEGRCKLHGGASPIKTGRYSTVARRRVRDLAAEYAADPEPLSLLQDLALLRAVTADYLERAGENLEAPAVADLLEGVSRVVERAWRVQERTGISLETLNRVFEQMGLSVARHVKDTEALAAIEREWAELRL